MTDQSIIRCKAWDLLETYYDEMQNTHRVKIAGGRVFWENASASRNDSVRLERLTFSDSLHPSGLPMLRQVNRYIPHDTDVELWPNEIAKVTR